MNSLAEKRAERPAENEAQALLASCQVEVSPESFSLVSVTHSEFADMLQNSGISPRGASPFLILADKHEVTLMLADEDLRLVRHALNDARVESGFRLVTFDVVLDFAVVGFFAEISRMLADAKIPLMAVSAYSRDHILIKQGDLARALAVLGSVNSELC